MNHQPAASNRSRKPKYYCRRCKRHLPSIICPLHGVDDTVVLASSGHLPLPAPQDRAAPATPPAETVPSPGGSPNSASKSSDDDFAAFLAEELFRSEAKYGSSSPGEKPVREGLPHKRKATGDEHPVSPAAVADEPEASAVPEAIYADIPEEPRPAEHADASSPLRKDPPRRPRKIRRATVPQQRKNSWWATGVAVMLLLAVGATFYAFTYPKYERIAVLSKAEAAFNNGEFQTALTLYQQFQNHYPRDAANAHIRERLSEIQQLERDFQEQQVRLYSLMEKAAAAFNQQRYLVPEEDNAVGYIQAILAEKPDFAPALELQNRILGFYFDEAREAFEAEQYDRALSFYRKVQQVKPDDPGVLNQINHTLALQAVEEKLSKLSKLAATRAEVRRLRQEKRRLKQQVAEERRKLEELSQQLPAAPAPSPVVGKTASPPLASTAVTTAAFERDLGIALVNSPETAEYQIVEETLIDGGQKEYLHREKPSLPADLSPEEITMVLAECIVGADGRVESVDIVSAAESERLNRLARESFSKYRYRPATFKGEPVRFKSIEVMAF